MDGTILGKKYDIINGEGGGGKLTPATADTLGGIKIGNGLSVTEDGTASVNFPPEPEPYVLPTATAETLGGVKVGSGLSMNSETGVLSNANMPLNYSTTEQNTGRKWIDGKDIYFKVVELGALPNATTKNVAHGITGISEWVKIEGTANNATNTSGISIPLVYDGNNATNNTRIAVNDTNVVLETDTDRSSFNKCYAILYYTKA